MAAATISPKPFAEWPGAAATSTEGDEASEGACRTRAWHDFKAAMNRRRSSFRGKSACSKESGSADSTLDLDSSVKSHRSLLPQSNEDTGDNSWRRSFDQLPPSRHPRSASDPPEDISFPSMSPRSVDAFTEATEEIVHRSMHAWNELGSSKLARSPSCHSKRIEKKLDSPLVIESLSTPALEGGNQWHGTVTIGQDSVPNEPSRNANRVRTKKLQHLTFPSAHPRVKKSKKPKSPKKIASRRRKAKAEKRRNMDTLSVAWGDFAMTQKASHMDIDDLTSPGFTRRKLNFRCDDFFQEIDREIDDDNVWAGLMESPVEERLQVYDNMDFRQHIIDRISFSTLPELPYLPKREHNSFLAKFHAAYGAGNEELQDDEKDDAVELRDVGSEEETQIGNQSRVVCFADEQGLPIAKFHQVGDEDDRWATGRIIVLYLDPSAKKFEFMQGEFSYSAGATVADLLAQLPDFATEERFKSMTFSALWSTSEALEFDSKEPLHQLQLGKREVTLAVMEGASGAELHDEAAPILKSSHVMNAVKKASRVSRGLKYIMSRNEMEQERCDKLENISTADSRADGLTEEGSDTRKARFQALKPKAYDIPLITMYDSCDDDIPDLNDEHFSGFSAPWEGIQAEDAIEPHKLMSYLHATLWATIGAAFVTTHSS